MCLLTFKQNLFPCPFQHTDLRTDLLVAAAAHFRKRTSFEACSGTVLASFTQPLAD